MQLQELIRKYNEKASPTARVGLAHGDHRRRDGLHPRGRGQIRADLDNEGLNKQRLTFCCYTRSQ